MDEKRLLHFEYIIYIEKTKKSSTVFEQAHAGDMLCTSCLLSHSKICHIK